MPTSFLRGVVRETGSVAKGIGKILLLFYLPVMVILSAIHFPFDTDPSLHHGGKFVTTERVAAAAPAKPQSASFYEAAYQTSPKANRGCDYESQARAAAKASGIEDKVRAFVKEYRLEDKRALEVGSGLGYLQDVVKDYTGLDLSPSVAHLYHKPFVVGSATNLPFADSSYDVIWSVWVMEHIPEPERALREMRRVLKPDGMLFLYVAWNCTPWAAEGFEVRPYRDFNWRGKLVKASVSIRPWLPLLYQGPTRALRWAQYETSGEAEPLRFRALEPNYETYWGPDSDAAISLDSFETYLWFQARGDACLNCEKPLDEWMTERNPLILRMAYRASRR
jgi:SAM-dependent methyltransferase